MSKHTKGPWFREESTGRINEADGGFIAKVAFHDAEDEEGIANGNLVAAAPELLEALKNLVADMERVLGREIPADHEAKDAISKAEGRTK